MKAASRLFFIGIAAVFCTLAAAQERAQGWYEVETLNAGLGARPGGLDLSTPRAAMRAFVERGDDGQFGRAAHVLNLSDLARDRQGAVGPQLARQLYQVFERRIWIDWSDLPSRPDAKTAGASGDGARAGTPRRNLGLQLFELDGRAYEIRLARYKAGAEAEPVWLFTPQTVEDVPALHDAFGPRAFERYIPAGMQREMGSLRIWEWVTLPVLFGGLTGIGWLVNKAVGWLARTAPYVFLQNAFARAGLPLALFVVAMLANMVLSLLVSFSGPVTSVMKPVLVIVMVSAVGIAALRVVDAVLDRVTSRYVGEIDDTRSLERREVYTSIYALRRIILLCMVGFAGFYVLSRLNLFESLGMTLLASAGVLTVLLGIAGQAVLGNILASLQIALAKPVRIGDSVLFEGDWAYVESIFYTFMRLRTWDERRIIVPVRHFISNPFENWSVTDARLMRTIRLRLDHAADAAVLREKFLELARADEGVIEPDKLTCYVTGHDESGQEVAFYAMAPDPSTGWEVEMRLREGLLGFIRSAHPDWWPRERIAGGGMREGAAAQG